MNPFRSSLRLCSALLLLSACTLDARDLSAFQTTASGPEKLRAILRSADRSPTLRAQAALSLYDLPRNDVNGRALLFDELAQLPAEGRAVIVPTFQAGLALRMKTERGAVPNESAVQAKDAGVKLLAMLEPREREQLGAELLRWMAEDLPQRAQCGEYSLEDVAVRVGAGSASSLVGAMNEAHSAESLGRLANLIQAHVQPAQRATAAQRLVELERAYRRRPDAAQSALFERILPALGLYADQPVVRARLIELASTPELPLDERTRALALLEGHVTSGELTPLLALAQSEAAPPALRVLALSRAGETQSREALPVLLTLLTDRAHAELRRRAGELALELGGSSVVAGFFRNLPVGWGMTLDRAEVDAYSERLGKLHADTAMLMLLGEKLHSSFWWNRVLALRYFAARGTAEDIWRIRQHLADTLPIFGAGWPRGYNVGLEAEAAVTLSLERHHAGPKMRAFASQPVPAGAPKPVEAPAVPVLTSP